MTLRLAVTAHRPPAGDWAEHAACIGESAVMFPTGSGWGRVSAAKAICARCPVVAECLDYALTYHEPEGVWGGMTPRERREAATTPFVPLRPSTAVCGTTGGYRRHRRLGEDPCQRCRDAHAAYGRQWKRREATA
jgi:WhiB family redox-sensing transcriptional regulator